jgi:hypothetical protein
MAPGLIRSKGNALPGSVRQVELSVLSSSQEALPLMPGKDVRGLAAVLRIADSYLAAVERHLNAAVIAAAIRLEPMRAFPCSVHVAGFPSVMLCSVTY